MSSVVAIVKSIVGQVIAVSPEGIRRVLIEGDRLLAGEEVLTGPGGAVTLELADGRLLDLGRDSQWSADAPDSSTDLGQATAQAAPSVEELQQAIAAGVDPTTELEAPAAGPAAAGGGSVGGGHSFVLLEETAGSVDPTIGFPTDPLGFAAGLNSDEVGGLDTDGNTTTADTPTTVATGLTLSATPSISEAGGVIVYTATVGQAPTSALTITLSNGAVVVIPAGQTSGTVSVTIPANDTPYIDGGQITTTVTGTTGGGGLTVTVPQTPAVTQITDTVDTTTATLTASPSVTEGGVITYTVTLSNPAQTPVTVTLSNGQTVTVEAGKTTGSVDFQTPANDVYANGSTVSTTITGASGGNFEQLTPNPAPAETVISDSVDTTTATLTASPSVTEGGVITYTVTLSNPAQTPVTVTLSNGQTVTVEAGKTTGSVDFQTPANDVYANGSTVNTTITGATGGNFEQLTPNPAPAETVISDSVDTTTATLTASPSVTEGGVITYTVTLSNPAQTPVTVTLSNGQTVTVEAGKTTGSVDFQTPANDVYNNGSTVSTTITGATGGNFEQLSINPLDAVTIITDSIDTSTVTLTANASVVEGGVVTYTASVSAPVTGSPLVVTLANGQSITIGVGESSGSVNFTAPNNVYNTNAPLTNSISKVEGGNYEQLETAGTPTTTVTDSPATQATTDLVLSATGDVAEGGQIVYTATLSNPAGTAMTVTLSNGATISIAAGQTTGQVTVAAPADDVYKDAGQVKVSVTGTTGGDFENLAVNPAEAVTNVSDTIDTSTVTLTANASVVEGGVVTYTASVSAPVTGSPLVVTLANGQSITIGVGESSGSVDFTAPNNVYNTNAPLTNSITKVEGGNYEQLETAGNPTTTVTDGPDTQATTNLVLSATGDVAEGGQIVYTATLSNPAGTAMTVTLSNGATINIAAGQTTGQVTVAAPADDVYKDAGQVKTTITGTTGGDFENLAVNPAEAVTNVSDTIDTSTVTLTANASVIEGGVVTYTASVSAPVTGSPLVVTLANGQSITIGVGESSGSVNFTAPNNVYNTNAPLTNSISKVEGGNYEQLDTAGNPTTTVTDSPATQATTDLVLSATGDVAEGGQIVYTATLSNPAGTAMTVTLSNGATINIAAGQTSGQVTVAAPADDVYKDAGQVKSTITGTTGGDFENLAVNPAEAVTNVSDTIDTSTVTLTANASVIEGGVVTYTASVSAPVTGSPLVVTLANGQSITIGVGESSGSVDFVAPNNVYNTNAPLTNSISKVEGGNYEQLDTAGNPTTTVTDGPDTQATTNLVLSATGDVAEGGQIVYTASLSNPAGTAMTVTLSNGATINIAAGQTTGQVTVAAPADDVYKDAGQVKVSVTGTTGGDFEKLAVNPAEAVTNVSDTIDTSTVTLTATPSVVEGGTVVYTASVSAPVTGSPLVVTLANGQSITIGVGESSGSVNFTAPNNVYNTNTPLTNSISKVEGGNYEQLDTAGNPTTTVTDSPATQATTDLVLSATGDVAEGGQIVYTATLSNPAGTAMTVTLSNGATINIAAGQTAGQVTVAAPADDVYKDAGQVKVSVTGTTGGDFEKLAVNPAEAVTNVSDTIDTSTVTLTATPSVVEGGTVVYTASVSAPVTGSPLVVTLANGQSITIGVGESSGSVNFTAPNNVYNTNAPLTNSITKIEGGNYEQLETAGNPTTTVTDSPDTQATTNLVLSATGDVAEGGQIVYTATLSNPAGTAMTVTLSNGSTINIAAGQTTGQVTVAAPADDVYKDAGQVKATITGTTGGDFENLAVNPAEAVTNVSDTIDTSTVTLTANASVVEGGVVTYTASVSAPVTGSPLVVTLANGQSITIGVGESSGSVNFTAPNNVYNTNAPLTNSISKVEGGNYEQLETAGNPTTTVTDSPDTQATTDLVLSATGDVAEGGQIVYTATLSNPAGTAMTVTLSNGATINIAAGQTAGQVTVAAPADDVYKDAGQVKVSVTGTTGGDFEKLAVNPAEAVTNVSDTIDTSTVTLTATPSVVEGGTVVYTASVSAPVTGSPLVVTLANGQSITIGVGESSGSVNFTAPNNVYNTNAPLTNSISKVEGGNYEQLDTAGNPTTTVTDSPATQATTDLVLSATGDVAEGGQIVYTATLSNPAGTAMTVTLSNGATINIAAGQTTGQVTVAAPADDVYKDAGQVKVSVTGTTGGDFENLAVNPAEAVTNVSDTIDTSTVTLTANASVVEGGVVTYTASVSAPVTGSPLVVTLANGQSITIGVGESSGSVDFTAPNNVYNTNAPLTNSITKVEGGNYEQLETAGNPTTTVTDGPDTQATTDLVLSATGDVAEGGQIVYTATLSNPAGTAMTVTLSNGATIAIAAGQTVGQVTVAAPADDVYKDAGQVKVSVTGTTGGDFEKLAVNPAEAVTNVSDTIDTSTVTLTANASVVEGGVVTYTASVSAPVTGSPLVVTL
uniref:retention module-containing protein n=1 Tax=Pseudomonas sp. LFS044 TaxID=3229880 RepID=UPI003A7F6C6C